MRVSTETGCPQGVEYTNKTRYGGERVGKIMYCLHPTPTQEQFMSVS